MITNPPVKREVIEAAIRSAFSGVRLARGISLRQAQVIDRYGEGYTDAEFNALPRSEITDDWTQVTLAELDRNCVAHLDADGFRYYISPLMLSVLDHYQPGSMRVIGTMSALYPKQDAWHYHMERYSSLDDAQKRAIAKYLQALPGIVELGHEHQASVSRALRDYWGQFDNHA